MMLLKLTSKVRLNSKCYWHSHQGQDYSSYVVMLTLTAAFVVQVPDNRVGNARFKMHNEEKTDLFY